MQLQFVTYIREGAAFKILNIYYSIEIHEVPKFCRRAPD